MANEARFPRTLLVSLGGPDARYKVIPRLVHALPMECIYWASFWGRDTHEFCGIHQAFARKLHWRLRDTLLGYMWQHEMQASRMASRIAAATAGFAPNLIWVIAEIGAAKVGCQLAQRLDLPLHVTLHDAHETAAGVLPAGYYKFFRRAFLHLMQQAQSVDVISPELLEHEQQTAGLRRGVPAMVLPPAVSRRWVIHEPAAREFGGASPRRIGLCGSMRVSREQWVRFLSVLAALPSRVEIVAVAYRELFFEVDLPGNVTVRFLDFVEGEPELIRLFDRERIHACYLGLWNDDAMCLFGRTSLSAKLTTYLAAGVPVIVDAATDAVAVRLVQQYGAGVCLGPGPRSDTDKLRALLHDRVVWDRLAQGARDLCRAELTLEDKLPEFMRLLAQAAECRPKP